MRESDRYETRNLWVVCRLGEDFYDVYTDIELAEMACAAANRNFIEMRSRIHPGSTIPLYQVRTLYRIDWY